ncbi:DUF418 domain-containing protein [Alteraurantiacibacter palmitatis]|uniref:DUF418 domain-containing protein n=1 Tax=Alteraurantiacibacter palmitatis TaxID=2054628 RepID=A0ABV7E385_9SPHN
MHRVTMVDALRGWALLGLFLVHCVERFELYWLNPVPDAWFDAVFTVFAGKAFAIFALLFGFGFATIMGNSAKRGEDFTWRFAWRLVLLLAIGTLHALVYRGDILQVLALVGLLLIAFDRVKSDRVLLLLAALLFAQVPLLWRAVAAAGGAGWAQASAVFAGDSGLAFLATGTLADMLAVNAGPGMAAKWSFYIETGRVVEIAGLFLVGMVIQRRGLFAEAEQHRRLWLGVLGVSLLVWAAVSWAEPRLLPPPPPETEPMVRQNREWAIAQWRALAATGVHIAAFVLLWHSAARPLLGILAAPGRMTLTLYVGQSLACVPLLYGWGLGLFDDLTHAEAVVWGLALFAAQVLFARDWFRRYRYGPLEWVWRAATYGTARVPMRQAA